MSRTIKQMMVTEVQRRVRSAADVILLDISGVNAVTVNRLRLELASSQLSVLFVRNSMAARVVSMLASNGESLAISGPTAIVYGARDSTEMSKLVVRLASENKNVKIKAGVCEGQHVTTADINELAKSPSREDLLSSISGLLLAPGTNFSSLLTSTGSRISSQLGLVTADA